MARAFGALLGAEVSLLCSSEGGWLLRIDEDPNTFGYALESVQGYLRAAALLGGQLVQLQDGYGNVFAVTDAGVYAIDYDTGVVRVATPEQARGVSAS